VPNIDPDFQIPTQKETPNIAGKPAKPGAKTKSGHSTGERNVNPDEEHSRTPKGAPHFPA
jgi:hypothetical protein